MDLMDGVECLSFIAISINVKYPTAIKDMNNSHNDMNPNYLYEMSNHTQTLDRANLFMDYIINVYFR